MLQNLEVETDTQVETRDKLRLIDGGITSEEMKQLDASFKRTHAMCIHINLLTICATLWYGWRIVARLKFDTA